MRWGAGYGLLLFVLGLSTAAAEAGELEDNRQTSDFSLLQRKEVRFQRREPPSNLTDWEEDYLHDGPYNKTEDIVTTMAPAESTTTSAPPRSTPAPEEGQHAFVYRVPTNSTPRNGSANLSAPMVDAAKAVAASGATNESEIAFPFKLVLPKRLQNLHEGPLGPLPALLGNITDRLCEVAGLQPERLVARDIKGDNLTHDPFAANATASLEKVEKPAPPGESPRNTTVIDFEVLPGTPRAEEVLRIWKAQLASGQSCLMEGCLGELLRGSKLQSGPAPNMTKKPCGKDSPKSAED